MCCFCEFEPDPNDDNQDPELQYYYKRLCENCNKNFWSLHCAHDGHQHPCQHCKFVHMPLPTNCEKYDEHLAEWKATLQARGEW